MSQGVLQVTFADLSHTGYPEFGFGIPPSMCCCIWEVVAAGLSNVGKE